MRNENWCFDSFKYLRQFSKVIHSSFPIFTLLSLEIDNFIDKRIYMEQSSDLFIVFVLCIGKYFLTSLNLKSISGSQYLNYSEHDFIR